MTPIQIWLHPRRTAQLLRDLRQQIDELQQQNRQFSSDCARQQHSLQQALQKAREELQHTTEELRQRQTEIEKLQLDAVEATQVRQAMDLLDSRVTEIEEMRNAYERRIAHLRHALEDAQVRLKSRDDYDQLAQMTLINFTPEKENNPPATDVKKAADEEDINTPSTPPTTNQDTDWLMPLPD